MKIAYEARPKVSRRSSLSCASPGNTKPVKLYADGLC